MSCTLLVGVAGAGDSVQGIDEPVYPAYGLSRVKTSGGESVRANVPGGLRLSKSRASSISTSSGSALSGSLSSSSSSITMMSPSVRLTTLRCCFSRHLRSRNQFTGASSASFFSAKGRNVRWKSDCALVGAGEPVSPVCVDLDFEGDEVTEDFACPKKVAMSVRDFACASCAFFSRSALAAFFSSRSFSCAHGWAE